MANENAVDISKIQQYAEKFQKGLVKLAVTGNEAFAQMSVVAGIRDKYTMTDIAFKTLLKPYKRDWNPSTDKAVLTPRTLRVEIGQVELEEEPLVIHKTDPDGVRLQVDRLRQVRAERDESRVRLALEHLSKVAEGNENIMPSVLEAVKAYATIGEITATLKDVFGVYREPVAAF